MVAFSRVLKRQAGASVRELAVITALFGLLLASVVGYGVYMVSAAVSFGAR